MIPVRTSTYGGPILSDIEFRRSRYGEKKVFVTRHLPRLRKAGINTIILPAENMREVETFFLELRESKPTMAQAKSASQVREIVDSGGVACILAASYSILENTINRLELLHELGVRLYTMSGNRRNIFADGCGEKNPSGLSYLGVDLVKRLEDLGILIDVSHSSEKTFWDIFEVTSKGVVVASHSNARRICDNDRNLSDEQISAIAGRGGIIGISLHPTLVSDKPPGLDQVIEHLEYLAKTAGHDHVGVGTDFVDIIEDTFVTKIKTIDPSGKLYGGMLHPYPKDVENVEKISNIFTRLIERGHDPKLVQEISGDNFVKVLERTGHS